MSKDLVQIGDKWFKVKIFGQQVNWATLLVSGVVILGVELWRRKRIARQINNEVHQQLAQYEQQQGTIIDQVVSGVDDLDWEEIWGDIT